jgi:hypothetical protein
VGRLETMLREERKFPDILMNWRILGSNAATSRAWIDPSKVSLRCARRVRSGAITSEPSSFDAVDA